MHPYANKQIFLATKHEKEKMIAPLFVKHLQANVEVYDFDTDSMGTFTGEIPRLGSAYETCLEKARIAAKASKDGIGLGNEGSFGPHPVIPLIACDHEIMVLIDLEKNLIIAEQYLSTATNYQTLVAQSNTNLDDFFSQTQFPTHALCIQDAGSKKVIAKGIRDAYSMKQYLQQGFSLYPNLLLTTDMRAMMNPSRMKVIEVLTEKFVVKLKNLCPSCQSPGFSMQATEGALPCEWCHEASNHYAYEIWRCGACTYQEKKTRADGKQSASPEYCTFCNP